MREYSVLYCWIKERNVEKCLLSGGHEREDACDGCPYQTPVYRKYRRIFHGPDPRGKWDLSTNPPTWQKIDSSNIRLNFDQPNPKRSHSRLPKKFFVTDPTTGKERRVYRADQEPKNRFSSILCFLCHETIKQELKTFCKEKGCNLDIKGLLSPFNQMVNKLRDQDRLGLILKGKQHFLNRSIPQLMKQPEMKPFKSFTRQILAGWRQKHCGQLCIKENPDLKIKIGRRNKN